MASSDRILVTGTMGDHGLAVLTARGELALDVELRSDVAPVNGLVAYAVALYLWLLYRDPVLTLVFPALHSIQYMVVVWRYELNYQQEQTADAKGPAAFTFRMALFYAIAMGLGYVGFWQGPKWLATVAPSLIEGVRPINPLDVLDCMLMHRNAGAFIVNTWTL